jgi:hypothetical protein
MSLLKKNYYIWLNAKNQISLFFNLSENLIFDDCLCLKFLFFYPGAGGRGRRNSFNSAGGKGV